MKSVYVKANDEVKAVDHNNLVDDTKELETKISQIPAGKDGNGVKGIELTKDGNGQIISGIMTMTDGTTSPITIKQ